MSDQEINMEPSNRPRSCCRCGQPFVTDRNWMVCGACRNTTPMPEKPLSFRERQVIQCVIKALPNKEIAAQLHLAEGTIKEYLNRIFRKVKVQSRTELAIWGIKNPTRIELGRVIGPTVKP